MTTMEVEEHFQNIRGSDGPQHGDEPRAPCPRAGRADAHTGASAASQRAPQQRTRHRLLSSTGDRGQAASRFASRCREGRVTAGSPPGAPAPALKPKPNAPAGPDRPGKAELPPGPEVGFPVEPKPEPKVGNAGILAFKDKIASLAQDTVVRASRSRCASRCRR